MSIGTKKILIRVSRSNSSTRKPAEKLQFSKGTKSDVFDTMFGYSHLHVIQNSQIVSDLKVKVLSVRPRL